MVSAALLIPIAALLIPVAASVMVGTVEYAQRHNWLAPQFIRFMQGQCASPSNNCCPSGSIGADSHGCWSQDIDVCVTDRLPIGTVGPLNEAGSKKWTNRQAANVNKEMINKWRAACARIVGTALSESCSSRSWWRWFLAGFAALSTFRRRLLVIWGEYTIRCQVKALREALSENYREITIRRDKVRSRASEKPGTQHHDDVIGVRGWIGFKGKTGNTSRFSDVISNFRFSNFVGLFTILSSSEFESRNLSGS